jgi:DNA-binding winged helix-turn-helix (wHTH) protein
LQVHSSDVTDPIRYRFGEFILSTRQRQLFKAGRPLPLIPRYFDLLVLLIEQRPTAVSRREIFDRVWNDVIVSDGALSQAVRTLRRTLADDSREPMFIRTVSRHGYSFVWGDVVEEPDDAAPEFNRAASPGMRDQSPPQNGTDALIERIVRPPSRDAGVTEDQRDAAEQLHVLGTAAAIERLTATPGHAYALALLRDARWDVPGAGDVPLVGQPEGLAAAWHLIRLRAAHAFRVAEQRWAAAAAGAAVAGAIAGIVGGVALVLARTSQASPTIVVVLVGIGVVAGSLGAAGVGAGIAAAEALARSRRGIAIMAGGALGGAAVGLLANLVVQWTLEGLFGLQLPVASGALDGLVLGVAVGIGYAATTQRPGGGMATPTGRARWMTALTVAVICAAGGLLLSMAGRPLVGGLVNSIAQASQGSQIGLTPLAYLVGHPAFGTVTKALLAMLESGLFGFGLAWGLTRRPKHGT